MKIKYPKWFSLNGGIGDIIYACAAIKAAGGGTLFVFDWPGRTGRLPMTRSRLDQARSLLELQSYVDEVRFIEYNREHYMNGFRDWREGGRKAIADQFLDTLGLDWRGRCEPWLTVDRNISDHPVIFQRSLHLNNPQFPWKRIYEKYGADAVFIGRKSQHDAFESQVGKIRHIPTMDLLEVARLISGCRLFVGNQSACYAIAEGLKSNTILEVCPETPDCIYNRINALCGWDDAIELPELA